MVYTIGATALTWLSAMMPPSASMVAMAGNSQYFLRTRRKAQNSRAKDT